jgi:pimeloyl-ACP methyl ester carboxylesterase
MSARLPMNEALEPVRPRIAARAESWRTPAALGLVVVGVAVLDGWLTASSLVWLGWLAIGAAAGLVARRARTIWVIPIATLLAFPVAMLAGRTAQFDRPMMLELWAVLVVVGGMVAATGFALGVIASVRRVGWITGVAIAVGLLGLAAWVGVSATIGSDEMVLAPSVWNNCDNPGSKYGWAYEAINYDPADDARIASGPGGIANCVSQGMAAGSEVVTKDGTAIDGWYIPAGNGADAAAPTIIVAPGWKSNKSEVLKYAPFFHDRFNLVLLDLRNQGRSGGDMTTWGVLEKQDITAMVDWLERTKKPTWIGATGNSMGAATVLAAAVDDPRIQALILDSMHADVTNTFADGIANERHLPGLPTAWAIVGLSSARSGADIVSVNPVRTITRMGDRPVLLIHGTNDILDTVDHAAKPNFAAAQSAGVPVTIQYCEGGGHGGLVDACPNQWQAWVDEFLAGIPGAQAPTS